MKDSVKLQKKNEGRVTEVNSKHGPSGKISHYWHLFFVVVLKHESAARVSYWKPQFVSVCLSSFTQNVLQDEDQQNLTGINCFGSVYAGNPLLSCLTKYKTDQLKPTFKRYSRFSITILSVMEMCHNTNEKLCHITREVHPFQTSNNQQGNQMTQAMMYMMM